MAGLVRAVEGHLLRSPAAAAPLGGSCCTVQRVALAMHYHEELELQEIARRLGITESRASHLHTDAVLAVLVTLRASVTVST
jgi:Sigma-70, region 4